MRCDSWLDQSYLCESIGMQEEGIVRYYLKKIPKSIQGNKVVSIIRVRNKSRVEVTMGECSILIGA
jgi:hypothetical protein